MRLAVPPHTQPLIIDYILGYACPSLPDNKAIEGMGVASPPALLPPNGVQQPAPCTWSTLRCVLHKTCGTGSDIEATLYVKMMVMVNAQEWTVVQFDELLKSCGWRLTCVRQVDTYSMLFS